MKAIRWNGEAMDEAIRSIAAAESRMNSVLLTARGLLNKLQAMEGEQDSRVLARLALRLEAEISRMTRFLDESAALRRALMRVGALFEEAEVANTRRCRERLEGALQPWEWDSRPWSASRTGRGEAERALEALRAVLGGAFWNDPGIRDEGFWRVAPESIAGIASLGGVERIGTAPLASSGGLFLPEWLVQP
jgi:hypothetical protein